MKISPINVFDRFTQDASELVNRVKEQVYGELEDIHELESMIEEIKRLGVKGIFKLAEFESQIDVVKKVASKRKFSDGV